MRKYFPVIFTSLVLLGACFILLISIGGFFPDWHWMLGWYSHPRPHFLLASLLAFIWLIWQQKRSWSLIALLGILINGAVIAPFFLNQPMTTQARDNEFSILHLNTNQGGADLAVLASYPADIIFLQEVTPELEARFSEELPNYEVAISHPLTTTQGIAMLINRSAGIETNFHTIRNLPWYNYRPLITTKLELNGQRVHLMSLHASRPHHDHADAFQWLELDMAAQWSKIEQDFGHEVIMIGDLNLTPWSVRYKRFLAASHTKDSMLGFGIQNSWAEVVPQWLGLPIDHVVVSDGLVVLERKTAPVMGSDHGLLFVKITTAQ